MKKLHNCNLDRFLVGRLFAWTSVLAALTSSLQAQISVTSFGAGPLSFDGTPVAAEFAIGVLIGTGPTYVDATGLEAGVQTIDATNVAQPLPTSGTVPPSAFSGGFRHNTAAFYLQSRPTTDGTNGASVMKATLQNSSGGGVLSFTLSYDFGINDAATGHLPGFEVFYSMTGTPGSWQRIPELSASEVPGLHSVTLSPGVWNPAALMYLLWADDNADAITDPSYTIDNFSITDVVLDGNISCVGITNQPSSLTVGERGAATFTVGVTGTPQVIQWHRNGVEIPGANLPTYSIASVAYPSDDNVQFQATISNALCFVTSTAATLTVLPDMDAPTIVSAIGAAELTTVTVTFSEPIPDTGPDGYVGNFVVFPSGGDPNGAEALLTLAAALSPDGRTVTLTTDPRMAGVNYALRITAVFDASSQQNPFPDTILPFIQHVVVPILADGTHEFRYFEQGNLDGTGWETLGFDDAAWLTGMNVLTQTGGEGIHAAFGGTVGGAVLTPLGSGGPNTAYFRTHFNLPAAPGNATVRLTNVIDDGAVFYVNGMDVGRVRMAPGAVTFDQQANANPGEPVLPDSFVIPTSALVAGDNLLAIEVHQNGAASSDIVMGVRVETIINAFSTGQPTILTPPQSQAVNEGSSVTLSVAADGELPLFYQWRKGNVDILGANNASYTINPALPGSAGSYSVLVSNSLGTANSTVATLSVTADTTPPAFLSAVADTNLTNITLVFSERLDAANAQNVSRYSVQLTAGGGALTIESAVLVNGTNVILTTSPRTQSEDYTVVLNGVTDMAVAQNAATPSSRAIQSSIVILAPDDTTLWRFETASNNLDGIGWQLPGFSDAAWPAALAGFTTSNAWETITNGFELRTTNMLSPSTPGPVTAYFRVPFTFPGSAANAGLRIVGVIDDGLVAYINGVEAGRLRITNASPVSFTNLATAAGPEITTTNALGETNDVHLPLESIVLTNLSGLVSGANLLAIELHQSSATSSDAVLSIQLVADIAQFGGGGEGPRLNATRNLLTGQITLTWTGSGTLQQATTLEGGGAGWGDVPGNPPSPYTFTPTGTQSFFRLR